MAESRIKAGVPVKDPTEDVAPVTPVTPSREGVKSVSSSAKKRTRTRKADAPPKTAASKAQDKVSEFTTAQIADALAEVLTFPTVPCSVVGDEWAAQHFTIQGREFANNIARQSEKNVTLRRWCERIAQGEAFGMLLMSGILYAVPPLIHWGIVPRPPIPLPGIPMPPQAPSTAAQHMSEDNNGSNTSNGNQQTTRHERHTP